MTTLLEVNQLVKHFPVAGSKAVVQAVNNISFEIKAGETLGLVGESGSGKTTVGRCIAGLGGDITAGSIRLEGRHITQVLERRQARGQIQMVFQESVEALDPRFRIGASIEEPLLALGMRAAERRERVAEVLDRVGLPERILRQRPSELSGGQLQRIGIARAIATRPKLLVLDEPTSALDPSARAEIIELLMKLQDELKTSCLFISHDLSTVRTVSQRIAVMYLGMIVEQGTTAEVFARPRHPYSVGLLSSILLPDPRMRRGAAVSLAGEIPSPINLPKGCFLAGRCPFVEDACRAGIPAGDKVGDRHIVHCRRHEEVAKTERTADAFAEFERRSEEILSVEMPEPEAIFA
ncbi:MAG: ABC transporter ATP-binding protein [Rhizobium sp.]